MTHNPLGPPSERDLLWAALDLPSEQREKFLQEASNGDVAFLERLLALVRNADSKSRFMEQPAVALDLVTSMKSDLVGVEIGRYKLMEQIGEGGMGVVYRAIQSGTERDVALKLIRPTYFALQRTSLKEEVVQRFLQEARAVARLTHENIVTVYEVGDTENAFFLSMQYLTGGSLIDRIRKEPIPPFEVARILEQICEGLNFAHQQGVIHRDVKPSNILFDERGKALLSDFGLAKIADESAMLTPTGLVIGTPAYMSPEQLSNPRTIGPESDVYSVGATLYQMLTGRPPFASAEPLEVLRQAAEMTPVPLRRLDPSIPRDLETIALKCLEKSPGRRYGSARELAEELRRYQKGEPILARPISPLKQAARWLGKNRSLSASIATAVMLLLMLVGTSVWYLARVKSVNRLAQSRQLHLAIQRSVTGRMTRNAGWTFENRQRIRDTGSLATYTEDRMDLRREYAAALSEFDLRPVGQPIGPIYDSRGGLIETWGMAWSPSGEWLALGGNVTRTAEDKSERMVVLLFRGKDRKHFKTLEFNAADQAAIIQEEKTEGVRGLEFASDDRRLFIGSRLGFIHLVDIETEEVLYQCRAHQDKVLTLEFDPLRKQLLSTCEDGAYALWDVMDRGLTSIFQGKLTTRNRGGGILLPNSLVLAGECPTFVPIKSETKLVANLPTLPPHEKGESYFVAKLKNSFAFVAVTGEAVYVVDSHTMDVKRQTLQNDSSLIECLTISPDERWIAICTNNRVWVHETATLREVLSIAIGGAGNKSIGFDPLGPAFWVSRNQQLQRYEVHAAPAWRVSRFTFAPCYDQNGKPPDIHFRAVVLGNQFLFEGIVDDRGHTTFQKLLIRFESPELTQMADACDSISCIEFDSLPVSLLQAKTGACESGNLNGRSYTIYHLNQEDFSSVSISPDAKKMWRAYFDRKQSPLAGRLAVFDLESKVERISFENIESEKTLQRSKLVDIIAGDRVVAVLSADHTLRLVEHERPKSTSKEIQLGEVLVVGLAGQPDGDRYFVGTREGYVLEAVGSLGTARVLFQEESEVRSLAHSPSGLLACGMQTGELVLWDVRGTEGRPVCSFSTGSKPIDHMEFSRRGDFLSVHCLGEDVVRTLDLTRLFDEYQSADIGLPGDMALIAAPSQ